ncbi:MAG: endonuclease/exonuclease/phosphatase family protein [Dehalococcoidia bacterium]
MNSTNRTALVVALLALPPWTWFLVRDLSPRFDAFAIGMPLFLGAGLVVALIIAALARIPRWAIAGVGASWLLFSAVVIMGPWTPKGSDAPVDGFRLAAANVRGRVMNPVALDDLLAQDADVLVVSEMLPGLLRPLDEEYAYSTAGRSSFDVVVYSHWPLVPLDDPPEVVARHGVAVEVQAPDGPFVLYGLHLPRPSYPITAAWEVGLRTQRRIIDDMIAAIEAESLPVVIAGDLNLTDRGGGYRALSDARRDAMRVGWAGPTSVRYPMLLLRIDHIFVPPSWCAEDPTRFDITASDHKGVSSTIGACPADVG